MPGRSRYIIWPMPEEPIPEEKQSGNISRRSIILSAAIVPVAAIRSAGQTSSAAAQTSALNADQFELLDAFAERLIPADDNGPGASQCGAAQYIGRALAGALGAERNAFVAGLEAVNAFAIQSQG